LLHLKPKAQYLRARITAEPLINLANLSHTNDEKEFTDESIRFAFDPLGPTAVAGHESCLWSRHPTPGLENAGRCESEFPVKAIAHREATREMDRRASHGS
jgi:hypothetical protein